MIQEGEFLESFDIFNLIVYDITKLYNLSYFHTFKDRHDIFIIYTSGFDFEMSIFEKK